MSNTLIKLARRFQYKLFIYASERSLNALKAKYPDVAGFDRFKNKNKYILWLEARFGENPTKEEIHPIEDCLNTLLKYYNKENGLAQKYQTSEEFRNLVKELTEGKTYKDLKVIENITIDEMEKILLASERKKEVVPTALNIDVSGDKVGKVGPWNIWLPSSRDNSVHIAGFDTDEAGNKNPKTTWCTARTMGSNLFYNYVGSPQIKFMLFYIIKNKPEGDVDYLSLGFRNGVPVLPSSNGSASVDRANQGLSSERLRKIWGKHYQAIMNMMP